MYHFQVLTLNPEISDLEVDSSLVLITVWGMLRVHAKEIAMAFINRADLRAPICAALYRLCSQNREILKVINHWIGC